MVPGTQAQWKELRVWNQELKDLASPSAADLGTSHESFIFSWPSLVHPLKELKQVKTLGAPGYSHAWFKEF